jgi:hypothetical protein
VGQCNAENANVDFLANCKSWYSEKFFLDLKAAALANRTNPGVGQTSPSVSGRKEFDPLRPVQSSSP